MWAVVYFPIGQLDTGLWQQPQGGTEKKSHTQQVPLLERSQSFHHESSAIVCPALMLDAEQYAGAGGKG